MRLQGVSFRYGRRADWVLRDVQMEIAPGQAVIVLGRNGAGKSTLLQLAAGVLRPGRGAVQGRPAVVGWVPERFATDQPFTVERYLLAMGRLRALPAATLTRSVEGWLDRLGLAVYRHVRLTELSKGTGQKVGLAQAMLAPPGLLVLDEPWEGLDAPTRELVPAIIAEVTEAGGSVLVSDHRGEVDRLPDAVRWTVDQAGVAVVPTDARPTTVIIELAVDAAVATATVGRLLAEGHRVVGVRSGVLTDGPGR